MRRIERAPRTGPRFWNREGDAACHGVSTALAPDCRRLDTAEGCGSEAGVSRAVARSGPPRFEIFRITTVVPESFDPVRGEALAE
ncbi:hypothetical protein [uncultured Jannaschia sp.]|uniref:hypothetical protein n=1 Tax=uncultured Jannaschia sp. TaxID=293347 RepID=UPI0026136F54|nr:hypothetical protein [uncultured Jannaschia sp.]